MPIYRASYWSTYGQENSIDNASIEEIKKWILKEIANKHSRNYFQERLTYDDFVVIEIARDIDPALLFEDAT